MGDKRGIIFKVLKRKVEVLKKENINQNCMFSENIFQNEKDKSIFLLKEKPKSTLPADLSYKI